MLPSVLVGWSVVLAIRARTVWSMSMSILDNSDNGANASASGSGEGGKNGIDLAHWEGRDSNQPCIRSNLSNPHQIRRMASSLPKPLSMGHSASYEHRITILAFVLDRH